MIMKHGQKLKPSTEGFYACDTVNGWRILEWFESAWWHHRNVARWMPVDPMQWVGPLPARQAAPKPEFDL